MRIRNCFLILAIMCIGIASCGKKDFADASVNAIVPHPASIDTLDNGAFLLDGSAAVVYRGEGAEKAANFLKGYLKDYYGITLRRMGSRKIVLQIVEDTSAVQGAYTLLSGPKKIVVEGKNEEGLFYGVQTLLQLLPANDTIADGLLVPAVKIEDAPAFEYRGMHLDVARHFMPVEFIKR